LPRGAKSLHAMIRSGGAPPFPPNGPPGGVLPPFPPNNSAPGNFPPPNFASPPPGPPGPPGNSGGGGGGTGVAMHPDRARLLGNGR